MKRAMLAIIQKDIRSVTANRNLFASLLIVPLVLTVILPSVFLLLIHFAPEDPDVQKLVELLPQNARSTDLQTTVTMLIFNYILPVFFLMIPIMTASIMAASSFVGEKERHTLETLLYCPLSVRQIFQAKVLASFFLSMLLSVLSFLAMLLVLEIESLSLMGRFLVLACHPAPCFPFHFADRRHPDRPWFCQSPEHGGVPAERRLSDHSGHPFGCRTVFRGSAFERLDPAGAWNLMCPPCRAAAQKMYAAVYLRNAFKLSLDMPFLLVSP